MAVESQPHQPMLVPHWFRLPARWSVGAGVLVVVLLAVHYSGATRPGLLDLGIERWLRVHVADPAGILHRVAYLGSYVPVSVTMLLVGVLGYAVGRWIMVLFAVTSPVTACIITESLKPVIGRTINGYWAFPSGHAAAVISLLTVVIVLSLDRRRRALGIASIVMVLALAVGFVGMAADLVREHLHYATDIIAGSCVGFSVVLVLALVLDRLDRQLVRRRCRNHASVSHAS